MLRGDRVDYLFGLARNDRLVSRIKQELALPLRKRRPLTNQTVHSPADLDHANRRQRMMTRARKS